MKRWERSPRCSAEEAMHKNIVLAFVLMGVAGVPVRAAEPVLAPPPVTKTETEDSEAQ